MEYAAKFFFFLVAIHGNEFTHSMNRFLIIFRDLKRKGWILSGNKIGKIKSFRFGPSEIHDYQI